MGHVEDFWATYAQVPPPSTLGGKSVYLFRASAPPCWESWPEGGKFQVVAADGMAVDGLWEALALAMLGEQLESVVGGVCNAARLALWVRGPVSEHEAERMAARLDELLGGLPAEAAPVFIEHNRAKR